MIFRIFFKKLAKFHFLIHAKSVMASETRGIDNCNSDIFPRIVGNPPATLVT